MECLVKFKFDIKANAIDSFNEALAKYEQGQGGDLKAFKFSITHLAHSIELVLKMYLQTLQSPKFVGADFVEYMPELDTNGVSKELMVKLIDAVWGFRA